MKSFNFLLISILCLVVSGCSKDEPTPTAPSPYPNPDSNTVWEEAQIVVETNDQYYYDLYGKENHSSFFHDGESPWIYFWLNFNADSNCNLQEYTTFIWFESLDGKNIEISTPLSPEVSQYKCLKIGETVQSFWDERDYYDHRVGRLCAHIPEKGFYDFTLRFYQPHSGIYYTTQPYRLSVNFITKENNNYTYNVVTGAISPIH